MPEEKLRRGLTGLLWSELTGTRVSLPNTTTIAVIPIPVEANYVRLMPLHGTSTSTIFMIRWDGVSSTADGIPIRSLESVNFPIPPNAVNLQVFNTATDVNANIRFHFYNLTPRV